MEIDEEILIDAITKWGPPAQFAMIEEECMELAIELHKNANRKFDPARGDKIIDEVADVNIMIAQANLMCGPEAVQARIDFKMARLKQRLKDSEF